jgi:8-oxo-dGTP diphosphatase
MWGPAKQRPSAVREVVEESGVRVEVDDLRLGGAVTFRFPARQKWDQIVSVFVTDRFTGRPAESDEIVPQWFEVDDLPLTKMWDDARLWLPRVLAGEQVTVEIIFAEDCETVSDARFSAVA